MLRIPVVPEFVSGGTFDDIFPQPGTSADSNLTSADNNLSFTVTKIENFSKEQGKLKSLPKVGQDISINNLTYSLKDSLSKYHINVDDNVLNSIHSLLQTHLGILNKALETQLKDILKSHSNHSNLLASVILHNYSSENSFPTVSPSKKKFLTNLFSSTDNFKKKCFNMK